MKQKSKPKLDLSKSVIGSGVLAGAQSPNRNILEAAKNLVTAYGPREAARKLKMPAGTVTHWAWRYKWKQAIPNSVNAQSSPSNVLASAIRDDQRPSRFALGTWTRKAAEKAAKSKNPLAIARKVRDVAAVYSTLWPAQVGEGILDVTFLTDKESGSPNGDACDDAGVIDVESGVSE